MCVVIVTENGPDSRLELTMLAEYTVRQCANGRAQSAGPWEACGRHEGYASLPELLAPEEPGFPCVWAEESRGVEAESTANERVKERGRNQVEAPEGQVGGRGAASHPLAALPRAPEARGKGVRGPPGPGGARGVLVKTAAAKGAWPDLR